MYYYFYFIKDIMCRQVNRFVILKLEIENKVIMSLMINFIFNFFSYKNMINEVNVGLLFDYYFFWV